MTVDVEHLPNDSAALKVMVVELAAREQHYEQSLREERDAYGILQEKFLTLHRMLFGRSSEKLGEEDIRQMRLFNEAEQGTEAPGAEESASVVVAEHRRRKGGRKPISDDLPCTDVVHDLSAEEKRCPCCGKDRPLVSEEISKEVEVIPAQVKALRHLRRVYGPCGCEGFKESTLQPMVRAAMPARMIPGSMAAPGLLAYVVTGKFVDGMPFYRQEKIFTRLGIELPRTTLCNWAISVASRCGPLIELMWQLAREGPFQHMDETTVQVLKEPNRPPTSTSYMWINIGYVESEGELKPLVLYHYHPSRSEDIPLSVLDGFAGYLQTDGYAGYNKAGNRPGMIHVGCFAHVRRYFYEAAKIAKKAGSAQEALAFIAKLYRIEHRWRGELERKAMTGDTFVELRAQEAKPLLEKFHAWLQERSQQVPPKMALGVAIAYCLNEWPKLERYLDAWYLTPDNNAAENAIRPFVVGRKSWLFCDTPRGAHASAALYSLVETARANGLEPYHYLHHLFTKLPALSEGEDLRHLLPTALKPSDLVLT